MSPHSAILLAGGQSSRMGADKALLHVGSLTLLEHMQALLSAAGIVDIVVSRNDGRPGHVADVYAGMGPLSGIHAGLAVCRHQRVLIVPVDMPLLTPSTLQILLASNAGCCRFKDSELPCVIEQSSRLQGYLEQQLKAAHGQLSVRRMLECLNAEQIANTDGSRPLTNTNTPEQWKRYAQEYKL